MNPIVNPIPLNSQQTILTRRFTQMEPLVSLLNQQLRRGVLTNLTLSVDDWRRELADSPVTAWEWSDGFLLFRERDGKQLVGYALYPPYTLPVWNAPGTFVVEVPVRPRDAGKPNPVIPLFRQAGFVEVLQRIRLSWTIKAATATTATTDASSTMATPATVPLVRAATLADVPAIQTLLHEQYSSLTGCLPTRPALLRDVQAGRIGIATNTTATDRALVALIHFAAQANTAEMRHLCTHPAFRRQGYAQALMNWFHAQTVSSPSVSSVTSVSMVRRVWMEAANQPARQLYEANGYQVDGWTSCVLARVDKSDEGQH